MAQEQEQPLGPTVYVVTEDISGGILPVGQEFGPEVYSEEQVAVLLERGIIKVKEGTKPPAFSTAQEVKDFQEQSSKDAVEGSTPAAPNSAPATADGGDWLDSVEGLTATQRMNLRKAGYDTRDAVRSASEEELDGVESVGPSAVQALKAAAG